MLSILNNRKIGTAPTKDYITQEQTHKVLWNTQNIQKGHALRPIVSSRYAVTHGVAKELDNILRAVVGYTPPTHEAHTGIFWNRSKT